MGYVRSVPVIDANGFDYIVYEFQDRRFLRNVRRYKLDSGELVETCGEGFVVVATGERLIRAEAAIP
jgi:hypothetical protein